MWIPQLSTCICVSSVTGIPFSARFESSEMMNFHKHTADGDESPTHIRLGPSLANCRMDFGFLP